MCEHTNILEPKTENAVPRLLKWNLSELGQKIQKNSIKNLQNVKVFNDKNSHYLQTTLIVLTFFQIL